MNLKQLERGTSGANNAKKSGGNEDAQRMVASDETDCHAIKSIPRAEDGWILSVNAKNDDGTGQTGTSAGDGHGKINATFHRKTAGLCRVRAVATGAHFKPDPRPMENHPDDERHSQGNENADAQITPHSEKSRKFCSGVNLSSSGQGVPRLTDGSQRSRHQPAFHQIDGRPVNHDGGDDFMNASTNFEPSGQKCGQCTGQSSGKKGQRQVNPHTSRLNGMSDKRRRNGTTHQLPLSADVEEPGGKSHGHGQSRQSQYGRFHT